MTEQATIPAGVVLTEHQRAILEEVIRRGLTLKPPKPPFESEWEYLSTAVWTKDEASGTVKQFPADEAHEYLRYLTEVRRRHPILAIDKSRRLLITWWLVSLYLYDVLTSQNHADFIGSRKLESSAYLLGPERMLFVYEHIPQGVWPNKPELQPRGKYGPGWTRLECPKTGSYVQAVASGADQLRQYTATNVFLDEFAFFERAEETWTAIKPTVEGGGHVDMVSTPELGAYMHDLITDKQ